MSLQMPEGNGTRGAGVVWHPLQKKYYASFAGNTSYPMGVFDATGKMLSNDTLTTMADTRGLWYNPQTNTIDGNGYDNFGWFSYTINKKGIPTGIKYLIQDMKQPDAQSQGVYNVKTNQVGFFTYLGFVKTYSPITFEEKGSTEIIMKEGVALEEYYVSGICNEKAELGLFRVETLCVDFYDIKTGKYKYTVTIPENTHVADNFSFAYTNGMIWLFDDETRKWNAFK